MGNSRLDAAGGPLRCEAGSAVNPWVTPSELGSCRVREEPSGGGDQASTVPWRAVAGGRRIATQDDPRPRTKGSWTRRRSDSGVLVRWRSPRDLLVGQPRPSGPGPSGRVKTAVR